MSDLQRSFAKAKLSGLPFDPPMPANALEEEDEEDEEEQDDLKPLPENNRDDDSSSASSASSASSTGTIRPSPSKHLFARPKGSTHVKKHLEPLPWSDFFSQELYLESPSTGLIQHVYLTPPAAKSPLFITHHGAGSSGLSFAVLASEIRKALPDAGILSLDARGHGETTPLPTPETSSAEAPVPSSTEPDPPPSLDLSLPTLSSDLLSAITLTQQKLSWPELPGLVLVGHSLGGAVVTDVAKSGKLGAAVLGYAVLDVVEGSAIDALQSMQSYLSTRPVRFPSLSSAIEWHIRTRTLRLPLSARVSVPSLLCPSPSLPQRPPSPTLEPPWTWRTDLSATQPFWHGWFDGLSKKFLEARGGKLLVLAGTDRLDRELMIGQMQGKYQLQVFPDAGHFVHEDQPAKTAGVLADFYRRNDRSRLVLPPKVGAVKKEKEEERE
ncbi:Protein phosphatase methylesterase 1 [Loxospora ochrophaea]|nr:Protein phosphatase methylesterase 1 [Loxospora ochrophaea]